MEKDVKPKSTGWRSTNSHWWGHVTDLMEQTNQRRQWRMRKEDMARLLFMEMAEMDEWNGQVVYTRKGSPLFVPDSWSAADAALANKAVDFCHAYADTESMWLHEYNERGIAEKVWYGKPREDA